MFDEVVLNEHELDLAGGVGVRRQVSALAAGRKDRHGMKPEDGWKVHVEGACGELAVAKYLGKYWDGSVDTFRRLPDLGNVEIRTRSKHYYELIIRRDDDPEKFYVLVTGIAPRYRVRGWIKGADARNSDWLRSHGNREEAWFVPTSQLQAMPRRQ
jgi:hypothetical protein